MDSRAAFGFGGAIKELRLIGGQAVPKFTEFNILYLGVGRI